MTLPKNILNILLIILVYSLPVPENLLKGWRGENYLRATNSEFTNRSQILSSYNNYLIHIPNNATNLLFPDKEKINGKIP